MRVLVVGGSGDVGRLMLTALAQQHTLHVFDLQPPDNRDCEYIQGDVCDAAALYNAAKGMDTLLYMAMGRKHDWESAETAASAFDVSVKGLYLALRMAHTSGIRHTVYTSSMSIYDRPEHRYFPDEEISPDATDFYGFTKWIGEEVCRNAARSWGMSVNALRLCLPMSDEQWHVHTCIGTPTIATAASDAARAVLAALTYQAGFQTFMISGDYEHRIMNMTKAHQMLGWVPRCRPTL